MSNESSLFAEHFKRHRREVEPLAVRMRPRRLDEFVGQPALVGPDRLLRRMLEADRITSALFYGPPGTGKTTLAHIIAETTRAHFVPVNAAAVGVKEIREALAHARDRLETAGTRTILFVDELHRFSRSQQDVLLDDVENGTIILVGATTENPFFAINGPLISRSQIFEFEPLADADVRVLLHRAAVDQECGLGRYNVRLTDDAADHLATMAEGDARSALAALEIAVLSQWDARGGDGAASPGRGGGGVVVDLDVARACMQRKVMHYDVGGDDHYDTISAMIKSMRGGDPDAAVYWLARMLEAGEDPRYIARRIVICAAEDVGTADAQALVVAQSAADATLFVGLPECQFPLAQAAIYVACAPKSNACARAILDARNAVREGTTIPVPRHLRSAGYAGARILKRGVGYRYPHDRPDGIVAQEYLGVDRVFYHPANHGAEANMRQADAAQQRVPHPSDER